MNWKTCLKHRALKRDGDKQLEGFLRERCPAFRTPRDAAKWSRQIPKLQQQMLDEVILRGWPAKLTHGKPYIKWGSVLRPHRDYVIRKLRYEVVPDYWVPALLYEPTNLKGKHPVVLNPNGHHSAGKSAEYKQARCINLAKRGIIALNFEFIGMSELEADAMHNHFAFLDLVGRAGVGLHYLNMKRALDVLLMHKNADRKRVVMTGLSGGGWQTIILSALDSRIKACVPVAGYSPIRTRVGCFNDIGDHEQCPPDMLTVADYDTLTAMLAPRPTTIILNENDDCCFRTETTKPHVYDAVKPTYRAFGAQDEFNLYSNTDPGTHNYEADNRSQLYKFLNRFFGLDTPEQDVAYKDELYSEKQLFVGLPPEQKTAVGLAADRAGELSRKRVVPRTAARRRALRKRLEELLHLPNYEPRVRRVAGDHQRGVWEVALGSWRLPMSFNRPAGATEAEVWIDDGGRATAATAPKGPPRDRQMYVPDLLGTGEMVGDARRRLLIETVGERQLGLRVAQLLALVELVRKRAKVAKVHLRATSLNSTVTGLIAAALKPELFADVVLGGSPGSLDLMIVRRTPYEHCQPLLCFGLLEVVDVPQLIALAEGVTITDPGRGAPAMRV